MVWVNPRADGHEKGSKEANQIEKWDTDKNGVVQRGDGEGDVWRKTKNGNWRQSV